MIIVLAAAALEGCGKSGPVGNYETKESGLFEPEKITITEKEAKVGAGAASQTYTWTQNGEWITLSRQGESRKLRIENSKISENGKIYEKK